MREFGEFSLIEHIKTLFADLGKEGFMTIGDDCAVLPYNDEEVLVVTTDMLVENIHFLRGAISPFELGAKSVAVNLSDVASMGARPLGVTLSIALPRDIEDAYIKEFIRGVRSADTLLLGGDTTSSTDDFVISVTAIGVVGKDNVKLRSQAQVGDKIYVTGVLGDSGAGLHAVLNKIDCTELISAHHNPKAHLSQGYKLGLNPAVHAMMDVSDGVASDLRHILRASAVSAIIDTSRIPLSERLVDYCKEHDLNPLHFALEGGEDYVLLFTASRDATFDFETFEIGEIVANDSTSENEIHWKPEGLDFRGFTHF